MLPHVEKSDQRVFAGMADAEYPPYPGWPRPIAKRASHIAEGYAATRVKLKLVKGVNLAVVLDSPAVTVTEHRTRPSGMGFVFRQKSLAYTLSFSNFIDQFSHAPLLFQGHNALDPPSGMGLADFFRILAGEKASGIGKSCGKSPAGHHFLPQSASRISAGQAGLGRKPV